jgi:xanthine dehydrogenase YagR molybdenum-binding subunit
MPTTNYIGKPQSRTDGKKKVTGRAKYAAEFSAPGLLYGVVVSSGIAKGWITNFDLRKAQGILGVVKIFTHENRPPTPWFENQPSDELALPGSPFRPLYGERILFNLQPIALVIAEDFETARYAAGLVGVGYRLDQHETNLSLVRDAGHKPGHREGIEAPPDPRGDPEQAFAKAQVKHHAEYFQPIEIHNPMENFASTVIYEDDGKLTIYEKTQGALNNQGYVTSVFGLSQDDVRVLSPFVGGAFGSGLRPNYQLFLAVMAALDLKRSVRVSLTRQQMFSIGHRPASIQTISLGAREDGTLESVMHKALAETSRFEDYSEALVNWWGLLYRCPNVKLEYDIANLDFNSPCDMRAPGATTGAWAIETAMDELAYKVGIDPVELRLKNYTERDQDEDKPFSSKELKACYEQGAKAFGWEKRNPKPRSTREGHNLVGWGMATGIWEAMQQKASAKAVLTADGKLETSSCTADIGTGTYTVMTQIAAETLGLSLEDVEFKLGDTELPKSPVEGGSWTVSSNGSAVKKACAAVGKKLLDLTEGLEDSPLGQVTFDDVVFEEGEIRLKADPRKAVSIREAMRRSGTERIEEEAAASPDEKQQSQYRMNSHSAVFVEVKIDEDFGTVHVTRVVSAIAGGRVINPKTARSQIIGGVVWGISQALHEEAVVDHCSGRFMNHNYAEYHIPVNADIHDIEVIFVDEKDEIVNELGAKGLGEIGIVGVAAAVGNAVYHATGKRVRELPITLDKLLDAEGAR